MEVDKIIGVGEVNFDLDDSDIYQIDNMLKELMNKLHRNLSQLNLIWTNFCPNTFEIQLLNNKFRFCN